MLFNSWQFGLFLLVITLLYYAAPFRHRWVVLLAGSYYFYMCWNPAYILLILVSTLVDYTAAIRIAGSDQPRVRRRWLSASMAANLGLLFFFKYYGFFVENTAAVLDGLGIAYQLPQSDLLLPVGISFYTFQTMSYTIDVYRRQLEPERHLGRMALYVAFFPQLVAGPIERAGNLLPRFREQHHVDVARITSGLRLVLWGLFKKIVIADRLAEYVNQIYGDPYAHSGPTLLLATYFFAFQIYCDFSGYSDIAIGSARVLGYDLMRNFNLPYLATSISDFWRRWHISLSTWFRDYVYFPLGGNRVSGWKWARNILAVFLISGLWHGANWTFIAWGALHGVYFLVGSATAESRASLARLIPLGSAGRRLLSTAITFHLVLLAWCFFRADNVTEALHIVTSIVSDPWGRLYWGPSQLSTLVSIWLVLFLVVIQVFQERGRLPLCLAGRSLPIYFRWPAYVSLILMIAVLGKTNNDFIYFQF